MDETLRFKEGLAAVVSAAKLSNNHVTKAQVASCFKGITLTDEQWELVYSYLDLGRIVIDDYNPDGSYSELFDDLKEDRPFDITEEEAKLYDMYMADLEGVCELSEAEEAELVEKLLAGNSSVKNKLIEGRLKKVVEMSKRYAGKGVLVSDIIQEGNMALMLAIESYSGGDFDAWVNSSVEEAFKAVVVDQEGHSNTGKYLAAEANELMSVTAKAAEELGREATLEELAAKMNLTEEALRDIMKVSMDALDMGAEAGETYGSSEGISDEDRPYFEAAYESAGKSGDGWRSVTAGELGRENELLDEADSFMDWLFEDEDSSEGDIIEEDYEDDGNSLENGWNI